jgi:hypothetical protein
LNELKNPFRDEKLPGTPQMAAAKKLVPSVAVVALAVGPLAISLSGAAGFTAAESATRRPINPGIPST